MVSDRDYWTSGDPSPKMFEEIASTALRSYLKGRAVRFGAPRSEPNQQIEKALKWLAKQTGDTFRPTFPLRPTDRDLGLDVVGWKDFADGRTGKVLVYMQCATGENWQHKRGDLDLAAGGIWNQTIAWTTPPLKALAIPYVVPPGDDWQRATTGILFMDRLRISSVLPARTVSIEGIDWLKWFKDRVDVAAQRQGLQS